MQEHDSEVYNVDSNITLEKDHSSLHSSERKISRLLRWIITYSGGLVKNEKQASYVALGFSALAIVASLFLFFGGNGVRQKFEPVPVTGYEFNEVDWPPLSK